MTRCPFVRRVVSGLSIFLAVSLPFFLTALPAGEEPAPGTEKAKPGEVKKTKKRVVADPAEAGADSPPGGKPREEKKLGVDEKYVQENLERHLHPTGMQFQDDGRVSLSFAFEEKKEEHESIFNPRVSRKTGQRFRWTVRDEEESSSLSYTYSRNDAAPFCKGLRISNEGAAHMNLWFADDVEAEIWYVSGVASSKKQTAAVVFTNESGKSIGSDHGLLCAPFGKGAPQKGAKGTFEALSAYTLSRIKLVVKDGKFEAWRDGRKKESMDYKPKEFASGRIGFVWGNVGSFINRLEITGKLDIKKMAAELRKMKK